MKKYFKVFLIFTLLFTALSSAYAQTPPAGGDGSDELTAGMDEHVWTVVGCAAFGFILGLSTLSFEEEPHEHYDNLYMGAAIGVILGVGIVAYFQADKSKDFLTGEEEEEELYRKMPSKHFTSSERISWHYESQESYRINQKELRQVNFSFNF